MVIKIAIVGAGLMGRTLAFSYVKQGVDVTLFERGDGQADPSCGMAAAGLLTPISELDKCDSIIFELGVEALEKHWPELLRQLKDPIYFDVKGSIAVAHPRDQAELTRFIAMVRSKLKSTDCCQALTQEKIRALEPELTQFDLGYYLSPEGNLDNQHFLESLSDYLREQKIRWEMNAEITEVKPGAVTFKNKKEKFDLVFDCRGLGAKSNFAELRGIRGELIWLKAPEVSLQRPIRFFHPRYSLYIAPRPGNIYLMGASEIESEDQGPISVRTTLELLTAAYYLHPGFAEARIIKTVTQCRPTLSDHLPKIRYTEGLIAVNGLYRHGFLIAPTLVEEIKRYLQLGFNALKYPTLWERYT